MTLFFRHENLILANPFPNDKNLDWAKLKTTNSDFMKMAECPNGQETLWEKEKLLVTSNFSFSHSVFYPVGELTSIFIKNCQTVGKGEIARNEPFLLFPQCFLPFWRSFLHFHQI